MARRRPPAVHGLAVVDKPAGVTSHDIVARLRRRFGERRIGHAGTLDPSATSARLATSAGKSKVASEFQMAVRCAATQPDNRSPSGISALSSSSKSGLSAYRHLIARSFSVTEYNAIAENPVSFASCFETIPPRSSVEMPLGDGLMDLRSVSALSGNR